MDGESRITCPDCGSVISRGAAFCSGCGHALATSQRACEECHAPLSEEARFCGTCGSAVPTGRRRGPEAPPAVGPPATDDGGWDPRDQNARRGVEPSADSDNATRRRGTVTVRGIVTPGREGGFRLVPDDPSGASLPIEVSLERFSAKTQSFFQDQDRVEVFGKWKSQGQWVEAWRIENLNTHLTIKNRPVARTLGYLWLSYIAFSILYVLVLNAARRTRGIGPPEALIGFLAFVAIAVATLVVIRKRHTPQVRR